MNWHIIKRLLAYPLKYKLQIIFLVVISLLGVVMAVLKPLPIKVVIDNVLIGDELKGGYFEISQSLNLDDSESLLWFSVAVLVFLTLFSSLITFLSNHYTAKLGMKLLLDLSNDLYYKLQRLSLSFYSKNQIGDIIQRFTGDAFVVYLFAAQFTLPVITSLFTFFAMFYVMAMIDLTLAIIAVSIIPLLGAITWLMSAKLNSTTTIQFKSQGKLTAFMHQSLSLVKIVQSFARENFMFMKFKDHAIEYEKAYISAIKTGAYYNQLIALTTGVASALLVGIGAYKGIDGEISAGELYIFLGYLSALYGPVNSLSTAIGGAITYGARGKRVLEILDSPEEVLEHEDAIQAAAIQGKIEFKNICFSYLKGQSYVLNNINIRIPAGATVAFIGPTGAGKTSLISLLTRFYDPSAGNLTIDDIDISRYKVQSLRSNISLVLQDPFLFPMTIAENIAFSKPNASMDEIKEVAKMAEAHDFISKLHDGYNTSISEGGASLSGGEKQRICLARAFLKESPILILDEPTSALDALTEARIFKRIANFKKGKTVIMISHRLSTIKNADLIYTIDSGNVVEVGNHKELLANNGLYQELYSHQSI